MRRLPHVAALLRPSSVVNAYGDTVDGPLAPVGDPFPAWLQARESVTGAVDDGSPVVSYFVLYWRDSRVVVDEDDVVEVNGDRYEVTGDPSAPVNPRGRARFSRVALKRVRRGGN